jgi:hypothetical protein
MAEIIKDGTGTGNTAKVNDANQLDVFAVTEPEDKFLNRSGNVYSIEVSVTPTGANDYFWYLKNTGTNTLTITDIRVSSTVATRLNYKKVSGTPTYSGGESDSPIVNRNLGSSKTLDAIIKTDVDITGLTDEGLIFFEECKNTDQRYKLSTSSNIFIPQGSAVAFQRVAATGAITMLVSVVNIASVNQ